MLFRNVRDDARSDVQTPEPSELRFLKLAPSSPLSQRLPWRCSGIRPNPNAQPKRICLVPENLSSAPEPEVNGSSSRRVGPSITVVFALGFTEDYDVRVPGFMRVDVPVSVRVRVWGSFAPLDSIRVWKCAFTQTTGVLEFVEGSQVIAPGVSFQTPALLHGPSGLYQPEGPASS